MNAYAKQNFGLAWFKKLAALTVRRGDGGGNTAFLLALVLIGNARPAGEKKRRSYFLVGLWFCSA